VGGAKKRLLRPLCKTGPDLNNLTNQKKRRGLARGASGGGKGRMPNASCEGGQALEKAQNGNGQLLEKVGMDLGLAPRPLGFGAMSVWGWRHVGLGLASRRLGIDGAMLHKSTR
jgi:hypothetical protein